MLRIGGVTIEIRAADPALLPPFRPPLSLFVVADGTPDLIVDVERLAPPAPGGGKLLFDSGAVWQLFEDADGYRIECRSDLFGPEPYKVARVDRETRRARIGVRPLDIGIPDALEFPLDELLVNARLVRDGGIEVHACGVVDTDGSGLLFPGNSGGGKTTTARLWSGTGAEVVSDDRVILRRGEDGWWMYGTPWHGEAEICSARRAPLRRVFLLDKSELNEVSPVSRAAAMARLLSCAFPPFHDPQGIETTLALLDRLCSEVPVVNFAFRNDASAVTAARAAAGSGNGP